MCNEVADCISIRQSNLICSERVGERETVLKKRIARLATSGALAHFEYSFPSANHSIADRWFGGK